MQKTFGKRMARLLICLLFLLLFIGWLWFQNNGIQVSQQRVVSEKLPEEYDGFVILHVSDLHNKLFGKNQEKLVEKIKKENPDIIVITGDLIDSNRPDVEKGLAFTKQAVKIAPVYFVTGNHDNWLSDTNTFRLFDGLKKQGVKILSDEETALLPNGESMDWKEVNGETPVIHLLGLDDETITLKSSLKETLHSMTEKEKNGEYYTILLAHQPQELPVYSRYDVDLVLSGHAHGGQFRIPFIGGFVAPDQGFLPKYTEGLHEENDTKMIISRGLGNSVIPVRLLNRPELVKITFKYEP